MQKHKGLNPKIRIGIFVVLIALVVLFPFYAPDQYLVRVATLCVMYSALALSLNLITGFMGQVSLGHAAFMGIGAYTSAILSSRFEWPFLLTMICALVVAGIFGMLLGFPALKLSGTYLAIVTLGFCEVVRLVELNWVSLTRGPMGMTGIAKPVIFGIQIKNNTGYYILALILLVIVMAIVMNIVNSHVGRGIMSVREDEIAAAAMGVNLRNYKVMTFTISSALAGMMGAFYAHYMRFIDPSAFNFDQSTGMLSMVILGGMGGVPGSILGAVILSILPEALRDLSNLRMLIYGLVIAVMMIFRPQGILGRKTFSDFLGIRKKYAISDEEAAKLLEEDN
ncbi:branched-chain amino acid ABC transporter permease [Anaerolentibacter hominis]|uniref:branched-chain amino acid ABC transporter permease n=1 Tax=Anaerolentibacter hominis TaxID=3079009 RepID=UPI0031B88781